MARGKPFTVEEELDILELIKQGTPLRDISTKLSRSYTSIKTLSKKFKDGYMPGEEPILEVVDSEIFSTEESLFKSYRNAVILMERALEDAKAGYEIVGENLRRIPLKTLIDSLEKAGSFYVKMKSKATTVSGTFRVDYKEMANLYKKNRKDEEYYNSERHMKDLLNMVKDSKGEL